MGGRKISRQFDINENHQAWLEAMAEKYGLFDAHKALRVVIDFAMDGQDEEEVFTEVRWNHCQTTANQD